MRFGRRRPKPRTSAANIAPTDAHEIDGLRAWALSLPFVNEHIGGEGDPNVREFVIDCPPLHVRRVWLLMRGTEPEHEVLTFLTHHYGDISCVEFTTPRLGSDARHVDAALLFAYESAFNGGSQ
jgi:hypothetical protein